MLGLSGSHRTGKTTLAEAFARKHDFLFVRTSASEVFAQMGLDPKAEYPIEQRLVIQTMLLGVFEKQYEKASRERSLWIADRTPIDLAAYMLADVQRGTTQHNPKLGRMVDDYVARCYEVAQRHFSLVLLIPPGIPLRDEPGKAQACPAYVEHIHLLQTGLLCDERCKVRSYRLPRYVTDLDERVDCIEQALGKTVAAWETMKEGEPIH